jgi:drug/metabolite transporter (DMT)-like permease
MKKFNISKSSIGILWMFGFIINITIMALCIRELGHKYNSFEIQNFRNFFSIIILYFIFLIKKNTKINSAQLKNNFIRNIFHFIGQSCWTWGITILPLALVFSLEFTMPIWASIIALLFLKEKITINKILFLIIGLIGTYTILLPDTNNINIYNIVVLFSAIAYAVAHNFTKKLTETDSILSILLFMSLIQLPLSLIGSLLVGKLNFYIINEIPIIIFLTITSLFAHLSLSSALKHTDASVILPIDYVRLPLIALIGWYYYDESMHYNVIIGSCLIIFGTIIFVKKDFIKK